MTTAMSRYRASHGGGARPGPAVGHDRASWRESRDRGSWRESAACRQADPELFFPIGSAGAALAEIRRAKAVCAGCPVRLPCLKFALTTGQEFGIWGGYDENERRLLRRKWRESAAAGR
jgi:WhiB family redox-sensing transcriptional regulator